LSGVFSVELEQALIRPNRDGTRSRMPIRVDFECDGGRWDRQVWGWAIFYNRAEHEGELLEAKVDANTIHLRVTMGLERDIYNFGGGAAKWAIELKRKGKALEGTFSGTFDDQPVKGKAHGAIKPLRKPPKDFAPAMPGEHPRLLFRKKDAPALKEKMKRLAAMGRCSLPPTMRYPFTRDKACARAARERVEEIMRGASGRILEFSDAPHEVAILYDLNYNGWDPRFRQEVTDWLQKHLRVLVRGVHGGWNPTPWSNWQGRARSSAGIAALDYYAKPVAENLIDLGIRHIRSFAADYSGASGAPGLFVVVDRVSGGGEKIWQMFPGGKATCQGNTFTIAAGEDGRKATLKGTFVYPRDAKVAGERFRFVDQSRGKPREAFAIRARSSDSFFVVMTLQDGPAPEVRVTGKGLGATVAVGGQTIRFDAKKIILGK